MKLRLIFIFMFISSISIVWADTPIKIESIDSSFNTMIPLGTYADFAEASIGGGLQLNMSQSIVKDLLLLVSVDYLYAESNTIWVNSFRDLAIFVGAGYKIQIIDKLSLTPIVGIGILNHWAYGDLYRTGEDGIDYFADTVTKADFKIEYLLKEKIGLFLQPSLIIFTEEDNSGFMLGGHLGASYKF